ncbi:MAG TPA: ArsA family ATPase [Vicinamibacteria bacterium]|nr:ArsA family ATPase [Vicinamibacteria bacterium]
MSASNLPRFRFLGGKGGVGKTTLSAALAVALAKNRRVLIVSTDPAHSLGDALEVRLGPEPRPVPLFRGRRLFAAELDADRALERWLRGRRRLLAQIAERGTYLDEADVSRLLRLSLPGVDELVGLLELSRLSRAAPYDDVVVDTAPTGHTLRLLRMPDTLRRIAAVLDGMYAKHRFLAESLAGAYRRDEADALIAEIDSEGRALTELLTDPSRCSFSWVLLPEALSLAETEDAMATLRREGIAVRELVVNRATPPPPGPCAFCEGRRRAERKVLRALTKTFPGLRVRVVPAQETEPRGTAALRRLGRLMAAARPPGIPPGRAARGVAHRASRTRLEPRATPAWLDVVAPPHALLLLFGGKGGVGKTTCAATTALALARRDPRRRILLLSADPAHSLADVLDVPLGDDERPLPGAGPALRARELDADAAFRRKRDRYRKTVDDLFESLQRRAAVDPAYDRAVLHELMDLAPPGLDELLAVLSVTEALVPHGASRPRHDLVVLDTAPTGHALRLLAMPRAALEWVRALLSVMLKYREVTGLGELASELVETSRELRALESLLHDPRRTRFVVVTRAAELPAEETSRLLGQLRSLRIAVSALVVDALTPPGCARCRRAASAERRLLAALARRCASLTRGRCPMILAPAVAPPPAGVESLERWGRSWKASGA